MADKVEVRLLKPLDGKPAGVTAEYDAHDVPALERMQAVTREIAKPAPRLKKTAA